MLLSVEDSLDDQLVRLILPTAPAGGDLPVDQDSEFKLVSEAVLRECIVNLARIKEAVSIAVQKPGDTPPQGLDNVPQLLRGITAGLLMLGKGRAVELMDAIGVQVRKLIEPGAAAGRRPPGASGRRHRQHRVLHGNAAERAQRSLVHAGQRRDVPEYARRGSTVPRPEPQHERKRRREDGQTRAHGDRRLGAHEEGSCGDLPADCGAEPEAVDPQFVELFIEEAKEEIASIQSNFPLWDQNPMDTESLVQMRRSFHTLKGSGRMVGARTIAEFGWSLENLMNRIIDKTLSRTPGMMALLRSSVAALRSWLSSWRRDGKTPWPSRR